MLSEDELNMLSKHKASMSQYALLKLTELVTLQLADDKELSIFSSNCNAANLVEMLGRLEALASEVVCVQDRLTSLESELSNLCCCVSKNQVKK